MPAERSAGAVIFKRDTRVSYLLLRYGAGHWDFVKGHIEMGEDERQTVIREIREEAGLTDIELIEGFREKISYFYRKAGRTYYKEVIFYLVEAKNREVKISWEHIGYEWLEYEKAHERLTYRTAKEILRKANSFLEELGARTTGGGN